MRIRKQNIFKLTTKLKGKVRRRYHLKYPLCEIYTHNISYSDLCNVKKCFTLTAIESFKKEAVTWLPTDMRTMYLKLTF